jgi:hypothetical protein
MSVCETVLSVGGCHDCPFMRKSVGHGDSGWVCEISLGRWGAPQGDYGSAPAHRADWCPLPIMVRPSR